MPLDTMLLSPDTAGPALEDVRSILGPATHTILGLGTLLVPPGWALTPLMDAEDDEEEEAGDPFADDDDEFGAGDDADDDEDFLEDDDEDLEEDGDFDDDDDDL